MKIKGSCKRDGREVMIEQVIVGGGRCPWDGESFSPDYAVTLVNALREAEEAGTRLEQALAQVADIRPDLTLDGASVLGELQLQIGRLNENLVRRG